MSNKKPVSRVEEIERITEARNFEINGKVLFELLQYTELRKKYYQVLSSCINEVTEQQTLEAIAQVDKQIQRILLIPIFECPYETCKP